MKPWQDIATEAQQYRDRTIASITPPVPGVPDGLPLNVTGLPKQLLSTSEVEITEKPAEELIALLTKGLLSSVEVTQAFLRRAGLSQKLVRAIATPTLPGQTFNESS